MMKMAFLTGITEHNRSCNRALLNSRALGRDLEVGQPESILLARRGLEV